MLRLTFPQLDSPDMRTAELRPEDIDLLGFTFSGGPDYQTQVHRLSDAMTWPKPRVISLPELLDVLTGTLTNNHFAYPAIGRGSQKPSPIFQQPSSLAKNMEPVPIPLVIHEMDGKVHIHTCPKESRLVPDVVVSLCDRSSIYILSPVSVVSVIGCSRSTIVIGAAAKTVVVEKCQNVNFIGCTRHMHISNCLDSKFYIHTLTRPQLVGDNRGVGLAPYNAGYPDLLHHLKLAGLPSRTPDSSKLNLWDQPIESDSRGANSSTSWQLVRPEDFHNFVIPVNNFSPADNPYPLPPKYASALQRQEQALQDTRARVVAANLTPAQTAEFQCAISVKFQEYLQQTDHIRELVGLIRNSMADGKGAEASSTASSQPESTNGDEVRDTGK